MYAFIGMIGMKLSNNPPTRKVTTVTVFLFCGLDLSNVVRKAWCKVLVMVAVRRAASLQRMVHSSWTCMSPLVHW